jgi:hypothetical protein
MNSRIGGIAGIAVCSSTLCSLYWLGALLVTQTYACTSTSSRQSSEERGDAKGAAASDGDTNGSVDSQDNESNTETNESSNDSFEDIDAAQLDLPTEIERIDIDRFYRERRTLYVNFLPLDPKFAEIHALFGHQLVRDKEVNTSLRAQLGKDLRLSHWIYIFGILELNERLSDREKMLLLDDQKAVIAHYMRTLTFIAKFLDENIQTQRYQAFLTRVYKSLAARHLYRNVRGREKISK